ncbi:PREDICTED: transposase, partial [Prunus dulcis]
KDLSPATFEEETKSTRGINTMNHVVKRKIQKIKPVVEYNKSSRPHGKAAIEMQSYIKWTKLPKDLKEQIWEAVQMAYVVGERGKKMVLCSAAKKWKDFKSTLTRQFILPFTNEKEKEKLKEPPQLYNFIEKLQWDAFVASRLSPDFEVLHFEQSQRKEKCEYNHRLSRKGYIGLEGQLEETMPGEEIDRSLLWKKAREDKQGKIPDPKVAEKAKLIDDLKKQVSEGTLTISGSNDILNLALGTPEQ